MNERKMQVLDLIAVAVLFTTGCVVGKLVMENVGDTWFAFNGPALGILGIGELIWWRVRKMIVDGQGRKNDKT